MVEESEAMDAENVLDYAQLLQSEMGDKIRIAALHGRMKQAEKDEIMGAFAKNEIQVLVSTTVIEVGINVPNATVIMVENAERFGAGAASSAPRARRTWQTPVLLYFYEWFEDERDKKTT